MILDVRPVPSEARDALAVVYRAAPRTRLRGAYLRACAGDGTAQVWTETLAELAPLLRETQWCRNRLAPLHRQPALAATFNDLLTQLVDQRDVLEAAARQPIEGPVPPGADPDDRDDDAWEFF